MADPTGEDETTGFAADVTSAVLFVSDLDRSVSFYSDVFSCRVSLREAGASLLLTPSGFQIYVIAKGPREPHPTGGIGDRHLIWAAGSVAALEHFEAVLRSRGAHTETYTDVGGVTFVEGRDPDGIRVMIAHPGPQERPRSVVDGRLYN